MAEILHVPEGPFGMRNIDFYRSAEWKCERFEVSVYRRLIVIKNEHGQVVADVHNRSGVSDVIAAKEWLLDICHLRHGGQVGDPSNPDDKKE